MTRQTVPQRLALRYGLGWAWLLALVACLAVSLACWYYFIVGVLWLGNYLIGGG